MESLHQENAYSALHKPTRCPERVLLFFFFGRGSDRHLEEKVRGESYVMPVFWEKKAHIFIGDSALHVPRRRKKVGV